MKTGIANGIYTGVNDGIEQGAYTGVDTGLANGVYNENILSNAIVRDELVLHLDAAKNLSYPRSGNIWRDLTINANNATLINGPTFNSEKGGSIVFDGVNDYAQTSNINLSTTNAVSVDLWCRIINYRETIGAANLLLELSTNYNNVTTGFIVSYADDSNPVFGNVYAINLAIRGNVGFNVTIWPKTLVNDLKWHHWCAIFDKSRAVSETSLYIDGVLRDGTLVPTFSANNTNNFGNLPFFIGGRSAVANSNMEIGNLKIYNRTLSAAEVLQNYIATKSRFDL
jgi:hypothetical protein